MGPGAHPLSNELGAMVSSFVKENNNSFYLLRVILRIACFCEAPCPAPRKHLIFIIVIIIILFRQKESGGGETPKTCNATLLS